jgi:hypothetical protein
VEALASTAGYLAAIIAVAAGSYIAARAARSPRSAIRRYLAAALITIGVATAVTTPETLELTLPLDVLPNLVRFTGNLLAMGASFCVLAMLTHASARLEAVHRYIRREAIALAAAGIAMIALLLAAGTRSTLQFAATYALNPFAAAYEVLFLISMCWGMASFLWLVRRYVRGDDNPRMRLVLRVNTAAAGVGLLWAAWKIANLIALRAGLHPQIDQAAISELLAALLVSLIGIGCTLPAWSAWLARRAVRVRARRAFTGLAPLWKTLTAAVPDVALGTGTHTDVEYALYRRVIEIRDAQMALRPLAQPDIADWARAAARRHGVRAGRDTALVVEAAELATALHAHHNVEPHAAPPTAFDRPMDDLATTPATSSSTEPAVGGPGAATALRGDVGPADTDPAVPRRSGPTATVCAEAHWLIKLSRTLATSPVVAELLRDGTASASLGGGGR